MLYGTTPWNGNNVVDLTHNIQNTPLKFYDHSFVSKITKNLIHRMLTIEERDRISWEELFQYDF